MMRFIWILLLFSVPVQAQVLTPDGTPLTDPQGFSVDNPSRRQCGDNLSGADALLLKATCVERDFNQQLASCRTCQNVAFVGVMVGFAGLAHNVNGRNSEDYHLWQFVGQTSASYLLYTNNTSKGGLLRWWGLVWVTNSLFQATVNRAAGLCGEDGGFCWTNHEETTWDLRGIHVPKLFHGSSRSAQLGAGVLLIGAGLTVDVVDHLWPNSGRHVSAYASPSSFSITMTY